MVCYFLSWTVMFRITKALTSDIWNPSGSSQDPYTFCTAGDAEGPCDSFAGSTLLSTSGVHWTWGPISGWILAVIGSFWGGVYTFVNIKLAIDERKARNVESARQQQTEKYAVALEEKHSDKETAPAPVTEPPHKELHEDV
jgi:hypothetical protein